MPNPKGSNVAMTSLHINVTKGVLDGEKSNQLRFGHGNLQKEIPTTRALSGVLLPFYLCPPWDEVVMLTLCSESLHRVHMASSVSLSIMENPAVLQTAPFGNTSGSLLAVLLLMQAKSMELESQRYGTSEKGWRDPWATTRTFGYQI